MKFGEHLIAHRAPEWRKQYIQYEEMKTMLYDGLKRTANSDDDVITKINLFEEQFFNLCQAELQKINYFYHEKLSEAIARFGKLKRQLEIVKQLTDKGTKRNFLEKLTVRGLKKTEFNSPLEQRWKKEGGKKLTKLKSLNLAFSEFYLSLVLLKNYKQLNYTGYQKIVKKHDKLFKTTRGVRWLEDNVQGAEFQLNEDITTLIRKTEHVVTDELEGGSRPRAMKQLRVIPKKHHHNHWTSFRVGLFTGILSVLVLLLILAGIVEPAHTINWSLVFQLYRPPLFLLFYTLLIGLNMHGWRSEGVNHVLIFDLDPRNRLSEQRLVEMTTLFGLLWLVSVLSFIHIDLTLWPPYLNPFTILLVIFILFIANPFKTYSRDARYWFVGVMRRTLSAPFYEVKFSEFFIGCQLISLVQPLLDFQYSICLSLAYQSDFSQYTGLESGRRCTLEGSSVWIRSFLAAIPAWARTMQCLRRYRDSRDVWPHVWNAARYSTIFFVVIFDALHLVYEEYFSGIFFGFWILSITISSGYGLYWDTHMDWGFYEKLEDQKRIFLRSEMVYPWPFFYYFAAVQDLVLRFFWMVTYSMIGLGYVQRDTMLSIAAVLEIYRRFVWNYFRVENEHLNNCGRFRVVRDISLAHFAHPSSIYRKRQSVVAELAHIKRTDNDN